MAGLARRWNGFSLVGWLRIVRERNSQRSSLARWDTSRGGFEAQLRRDY